MITLHKPFIEIVDDVAFLKCCLNDGKQKKDYELWFSTDFALKDYLTDEVADAFLLIALQIAMKSGQDIRSEAPVSQRLVFNLINSVMPLLNRLYSNEKVVSIYAPLANLNYGGKGVGTGCSMGVDSFSTIIDLLSDRFPEGIRLNTIALFNSGQHGDIKLEQAEQLFFEDVKAVRMPASELGVRLVWINSNVNRLFLDYKYKFRHRFVVSTCSFPLAMQKYFKSYTYASAYPIDDFQLEPEDVSSVEYALAPLLSTESTAMHNSNLRYSRVDKTRIIADSPLAHKYLNVCWKHQLNNKYGTQIYMRNKEKLNCGICPKCMRTLMALDVMGKIDKFEDIFDLTAYRSYRIKYMVRVLGLRDKDHFMAEIYQLMQEIGYYIPLKVKLMGWCVRIGLYSLAQRLFGLTTMAHDKN